MSTLLDKANAIKLDKDTNLLPQNLRQGITCLGVEGNLAPDKPDQSKTVSPTTDSQTITPDTGYELASVTINPVTNSIDANIIAENIKSGVTILGVSGKSSVVDTSDANAVAGDITSGHTAYVNGIKITGTAKSEQQVLNEYYDTTLTNQKYQYGSVVKKNPAFNTSSLTTMQDMFAGSDLQEVDTTGFNSSKVTNMSGMCRNCSNLKTFNGSGLDTSNVTDMSQMFMNDTGLTSVGIVQFNTSRVTDMSYMFAGCTTLSSLDLSTFNMSAVTTTEKMFYNCSNLMSLNIKGWDYSSIVNTTDMFTGIPQDCKIKVASQAQKDWVLSIRADLTNISIAKEIFLAWGDYYGKMSYSNNGINWSNINLANYYYTPVWDVASNGSRLVALYGESGNNPKYIKYSDDGITWTSATFTGGNVYQGTTVNCINGKFVITEYYSGNYICTSPDGINWTKQSISSPFNTSTNPISSMVVNTGSMLIMLSGYYSGQVTKIYTSPDGTNWTLINSSAPYSISKCWYYDNKLIAIRSWSSGGYGYSELICSEDYGMTWSTLIDSDGTKPGSLGYHNGLYVMCDSYPGNIATSSDLVNWSSTSYKGLNQVTGKSEIGYGFGKFVVPRKGGGYYSEDGVNWIALQGLDSSTSYRSSQFFEL